MVIGFTGTQAGLTWQQSNLLWTRLSNDRDWSTFRHGNCIGADEQAARLAVALLGYRYGGKERHVVAHPGYNPSKQSTQGYWTQKLDPLPNLMRNQIIVDNVDVLLAAPRTVNEQVRSGTWATIRYARKRGVKVEILEP